MKNLPSVLQSASVLDAAWGYNKRMIQDAGNDRANPAVVRMPRYTGIIECDDERLILKPNYFRGKRSHRLWGAVIGLPLAALPLLFAAWFWRFQVSPYPLIGIWLVQVVGMAFMSLMEDTIIILKDRGDVVRERRFLLGQWKWKKRLAGLADIQSIQLGEWVEAGALGWPLPFVIVPQPKELDWIYLVKNGKRILFWYTKYRQAAVVIAQKLAAFSGAPLEDPGGLANPKSSVPE